MDFKKSKKLITGFISICFIILFFGGCSEKDKSNTDNTFYVELINFNNDTLKQALADNIFGKVSYYKDNQLEILSVNFVTDNLPEMHYFKNA
jgi:hypothetical protein